MRIWIDHGKIWEAATMLEGILRKLPIDQFDDTRYYPSPRAPASLIVSYFLAMVAIDHRLGTWTARYEGYVEGELYRGADLLYRLGARKLNEDPDFFAAERLAKITVSEAADWLGARAGGEVRLPRDLERRVALLRDLGAKLEALYEGDSLLLLRASGGYLRRGVGEGLIDRLKVFVAYQDPVEKKAFLLAKFLDRRLSPFKDSHNKEVPVDNHLSRIALRVGLIRLDQATMEKISRAGEFEAHEDVLLRMASRVAYKKLAGACGADPFVLDDFLWKFGRTCCTREAPICRPRRDEKPELREPRCEWEVCPLAEICAAASDPALLVPEHNFTDTWWY
ncbi:MAG: hypothetical protein QW405_02255 [Fervidicoccaceae archaeon]